MKKKTTTKTLKASEEFVIGKHNIGYVWDSFKNEFSEDEILPGKVMGFQKLPRTMTDSEILKELKPQECTLGDILATLDAATEEMKDGYSNIFYVKGHSRVVLVYWRSGRREWDVGGWDRDDGSWGEGSRVGSPATGSVAPSSSPSDSLTLPDELTINGIVYIKNK